MDPTETGENLDSQQPCLPNSRHPERPERAQCWTTRCARIPEAHKPTSKNLSKIYMWMVVWTASRDISPPLRTGKSSLRVKPYAACTMDHPWNKCKKNLPKMLGRPPGGVCWPNKKCILKSSALQNLEAKGSPQNFTKFHPGISNQSG